MTVDEPALGSKRTLGAAGRRPSCWARILLCVVVLLAPKSGEGSARRWACPESGGFMVGSEGPAVLYGDSKHDVTFEVSKTARVLGALGVVLNNLVVLIVGSDTVRNDQRMSCLNGHRLDDNWRGLQLTPNSHLLDYCGGFSKISDIVNKSLYHKSLPDMDRLIHHVENKNIWSFKFLEVFLLERNGILCCRDGSFIQSYCSDEKHYADAAKYDLNASGYEHPHGPERHVFLSLKVGGLMLGFVGGLGIALQGFNRGYNAIDAVLERRRFGWPRALFWLTWANCGAWLAAGLLAYGLSVCEACR
jgi:hypothetical protein